MEALRPAFNKFRSMSGKKSAEMEALRAAANKFRSISRKKTKSKQK